jgi:hypothetical protein
MAAAGMIKEVMEHDGPLAMVATATGQRLGLVLQLLDQPVLVRRDDVHAFSANRTPVEKQLLRRQ